jgi:hypothetical protein
MAAYKFTEDLHFAGEVKANTIRSPSLLGCIDSIAGVSLVLAEGHSIQTRLARRTRIARLWRVRRAMRVRRASIGRLRRRGEAMLGGHSP